MSTANGNGAPSGMPAHLWELAKRDARGLMPDRLRQATDTSASAPAPIRAFARRAAALAGVLGAAGAIEALTSGHDAVATAATASPLPGQLDPAPTVPGAAHGPGGSGGTTTTDGAGGGHVTSEIHGADGAPTAGGLGTTWHVGVDDGSGHQAVLAVQMFQDVVVTETADGQYVVDAYQVIRIVDPNGHEHLFTDHYEVVVPDPPGQETDLVIHETGHVRLVENPDGSFTPVVDHDITVTAGADGDGHDEVTIDQDERVSIQDHDPHHGDVVKVSLSEKGTSTSDDAGDESTTTVHQGEGVDDGTTADSTALDGTPAVPHHGATQNDRPDPASGRGETASAGTSGSTGSSSAGSSSAGSSSAGSGAVASGVATAAVAAPVALSVPETATLDATSSTSLPWHTGSQQLDPVPFARSESTHPGDAVGGDHAPGAGPAVSFAGTQAPGTQAPGTQAPGTQAPGTQAPGTQAPGVGEPGSAAPDGPGTAIGHQHDVPDLDVAPSGHEHTGHEDSGQDPLGHEAGGREAGSDHTAADTHHHALDHAGLG